MELFNHHTVKPLPQSLLDISKKHEPKRNPYLLPVDLEKL